MNNSTTYVVDSEASRYVALVLMCLVNTTAIVGNVSIIVVVLRSFQLRHTLTNFFVLNLCFVDFLASVVALPMGISSFVQDAWPYDSHWCIASGFLTNFAIFASICSLCVISMERYYSIKLPMHHAANMTLRKTVTAILFVWVQSTILAILPVLGVNSYSYQDHKKYCSFVWQGSPVTVIYVIFISVWSFLIPSVILLLMHCGIFRVAREAALQIRPYPNTPTVSVLMVETQSDSRTSGSTHHVPVTCRKCMCWCMPGDDNGVHVVERSMSAHLFQHTPRSNKGHLKAIKTLIIIFSSFLLLWGPFFILHVHGAINGYVAERETTELLTTWLGYTSFAVNPLLYGWMNRAIRQELVSFYQNTVFFCFYVSHSQHVQSDAPREHEDFIQFLERTSYKANSPSPNQRTTVVTSTNKQTQQGNVNVNKEQAQRESIITLKKEQAHREKFHNVKKEQIHWEGTNNTMNKEQPRETVHDMNKEQTRENIHNVNKEQTCETIHDVNKEQTRENIHNVNKEQTRETIHNVNKEQTRENIHNVNKGQSRETIYDVNKEQTCETIHNVNKEQTRETIHDVNKEQTCENMHNVNNEQTRKTIHNMDKEETREHTENVDNVSKEQSYSEHNFINIVNKEQIHCEHVHTVNNKQANSDQSMEGVQIVEHVHTMNKETHTEHAHTVNKKRTHHELVHTLSDERTQQKQVTIINSEHIHSETLIIVNSEEKDHVRLITLNNNQTYGKLGTNESKEQKHGGSVRMSNDE